MICFADVYRDARVLVTGHTGFKGSWLSLWLQELGALVSGLGLDPSSYPNHWDLIELSSDDRRIDIRDLRSLTDQIAEIRPEIIFHLAAQPIVRRSYVDPIGTWSTNVMGTANLLEACRLIQGVKAVVVVTTDKCYENREWLWGYRETDRLGGHDPYSASKAGVELVAASYRSAFFSAYVQSSSTHSTPLVATARAGNVIGGGDWSEDRLIPDLVRAIGSSRAPQIRYPKATRPWQHVLESLCGYLILGQKLLTGNHIAAQAWNFGPEADGNQPVLHVLQRLKVHWPDLSWEELGLEQPHEATLLYLDSTKSKQLLDWQSVWNLETTLEKTAIWYKEWSRGRNILSHQQLYEYVEDARQNQSVWSK